MRKSLLRERAVLGHRDDVLDPELLEHLEELRVREASIESDADSGLPVAHAEPFDGSPEHRDRAADLLGESRTQPPVEETLLGIIVDGDELQAMDTAIEGLAASVRLERQNARGDLAAGPAVEQAGGSGDLLAGGFLSWTMPIFDQNQAQVAKAEFKLVQMVKLRESAAVTVAQDVRSTVDRPNTVSENLTFYSEELLPQTERTLELAQQSYLAGRTDLLAYVAVQQRLLEVRRGHVTLRLEAAAATAQLDRVVGAPVMSEVP